MRIIASVLVGFAVAVLTLIAWEIRPKPWLVEGFTEYQRCGRARRHCFYDGRNPATPDSWPEWEIQQACVDSPPSMTSKDDGESRQLLITCHARGYTGFYTVVVNRNRKWGTVLSFHYVKDPESAAIGPRTSANGSTPRRPRP